MEQKIDKIYDKSMNICNSVSGVSIKKIIIKNMSIDSVDIKLIFVGTQTDKVKNILNKLEKGQSITKQEQKELDTEIPFYTKKFGILDNYKIYFIYKYFEENISIYHAKIILCDTIKEKLGKKVDNKIFHPNNILLYKYSRNLDYKYLINILNYIFDGEKELSNADFISKLQKSLNEILSQYP